MEERPKYISEKIGFLGQFASAIDDFTTHKQIVSSKKVKKITGPSDHIEAIERYLSDGGKVTRLGPAYAEEPITYNTFASMRESSYNE